MPKITLPSGHRVIVGIFHDTETDTQRRFTKITITTLNGEDPSTDPMQTAEVKAVCSLQDNFCRKAGRQIAAGRILTTEYAKKLTKEDRHALMERLCPEFFFTKEEIQARYRKVKQAV